MLQNERAKKTPPDVHPRAFVSSEIGRPISVMRVSVDGCVAVLPARIETRSAQARAACCALVAWVAGDVGKGLHRMESLSLLSSPGSARARTVRMRSMRCKKFRVRLTNGRLRPTIECVVHVMCAGLRDIARVVPSVATRAATSGERSNIDDSARAGSTIPGLRRHAAVWRPIDRRAVQRLFYRAWFILATPCAQAVRVMFPLLPPQRPIHQHRRSRDHA